MSMSTPLNVIQPDDPAWYARGLHFTCTQCGNCCTGGPGYVWVSREEILRLAEHLELSPEEVVEKYCRKINGRFSFKERRHRGSYDCIFLQDRTVKHRPEGADREIETTVRVCSIYPVRPLQCRTWPFWESNLASPRTWETAAQRCPGMNQGRKFTRAQIHRIRDAADWPKNPPSSDKS